MFRIFAARAAAELRRLRADAEVRAREQKLRRVVEGAMDAIVEVDRDLPVSLANAAAATLFRCPAVELAGSDLTRFLARDSAERLRAQVRELGDRRSVWISGLRARTAGGGAFPAEATLSVSEQSLILILRNLNERAEAEYLREEVRELRGPGEILARARPSATCSGARRGGAAPRRESLRADLTHEGPGRPPPHEVARSRELREISRHLSAPRSPRR